MHKALVPITQVQDHNYKLYVFSPTNGVFTKLRKAEVNLLKFHRKYNLSKKECLAQNFGFNDQSLAHS